MSGHTSLKVFTILVLTAISWCPRSQSSIVRNRRFVVDLSSVGSLQGGLPSPSQVLDDWCANLTQHLNTTLEKFDNITFKRSLASSNISSGVTLLQRLKFDLNHVKVYSLLFGQIPSFLKGQQSDVCLQAGAHAMARLVTNMELTESYLNGTSVSPPKPLQGSHANQTRYQDIGREMALLKGQMRELVILIGNQGFGSLQVISL